MKKVLISTAILLFTVSIIHAAQVFCPTDPYASCYDTGQIAPNGGTAHLYHCTCGHDVWTSVTETPQGQSTKMPLPALAIQAPRDNTASLIVLAAMLKQRCEANGGILYKPHWYSKTQCASPAQVQAQESAKARKGH